MSAVKPLRADARRNRERVVAAALEVFAERGALAQMDEIALQAGVGVGTVYRHFPTKDALVGELVRLKFVDIAERVRRWAEVENPWWAFEGLMRENVDHVRADAAQQRLMWDAPQAAYDIAADALAELRATVTPILRRAQDAGVLRADFSPDDIGTFLCGCGGAIAVMEHGGSHDVDRLLEIWLAGARAGAG